MGGSKLWESVIKNQDSEVTINMFKYLLMGWNTEWKR